MPSTTPVKYEWVNGSPKRRVGPPPLPRTLFLFEPEWITALSWVCVWTARGCLLLCLLVGCGAGSDDSPSSPVASHPDDLTECLVSAYEAEVHLRCTSLGELQRLHCGEWETLDVCVRPEDCSPGPVIGCR